MGSEIFSRGTYTGSRDGFARYGFRFGVTGVRPAILQFFLLAMEHVFAPALYDAISIVKIAELQA